MIVLARLGPIFKTISIKVLIGSRSKALGGSFAKHQCCQILILNHPDRISRFDLNSQKSSPELLDIYKSIPSIVIGGNFTWCSLSFTRNWSSDLP